MQTVRKYSDKFDSLIQLSKDYKLDNITSELKSETDKLKNEYLFLVVIGQFKRGKSTLINSLIGHNLLPTAVLPLTSIVTMIKFSEEQKINIIFEDEHN
jgi:ribosome biogenesis GTPase A